MLNKMTISSAKATQAPNLRRERRLLTKARKGDLKAREDLIKMHIPYVISVAKRFHRHAAFLELQDLIQQGCIGLIQSIERFDLRLARKRKVRAFLTYATYWIENAIRKEIIARGRTISLPWNVFHYIQQRRRAKQEEHIPDSNSIDLNKLADHLKISKRMQRKLDSGDMECVSIDANPEGEDSNDFSLSTELAVHDDNDFTYRDELERLLNVLNERELLLIRHRFGLIPGENPKIRRDIANILGVCEDRVRQIENRAISKLRAASMLQHGESFGTNTLYRYLEQKLSKEAMPDKNPLHPSPHA